MTIIQLNKGNIPKAIAFYTYLPPWRIDVFNEMGKYYDLTIIFLCENPKGMKYDQDLLRSKLHVKHFFYQKGFNIKTRQFRTGILKLIKEYKPDVVFSHEYSPTSILLSLFLRFKLCRFKYVITTSDNLQMAVQAKTFRSWSRSFVLSAADGIIVYSVSVKNWYSKKFSNLTVEICPNIQNPESLLASAKKFIEITPDYIKKFDLQDYKIALYVGRLTEVKGLDLLFHAFAKSENKNFKLVIVGEGNLKESLKELAQKIGIDNKIVFAGRYDGDNLYAWYSIANFFILPSRYEPFGAVVNEALVLGTPVIASKYIGALDFIREGENGSVFDPLNEVEFVNILNRSMKEFENVTEPRKNLMVTSFNDHVKVFSKFAS